MSKLRIRIDVGFTETPLDVTVENMQDDVAQLITAKVLEILTEASTHKEMKDE